MLAVTMLARSEKSDHHDLEGLGARAAELEGLLRDQSSQLARMRADLDAFRIDYRQRVGALHEELDALEIAIAEAELGELSKQGKVEANVPHEPRATAPPPRYTSDAIRRLFRDVAKAIHPDLSRDELARDRRHALMAEANRAYALGDEEQLRWILQAWERSPEAVQGSDPEAVRLRLVRRIGQLEEQLSATAQEVASLQASPLGKLKVLVDEAAAKGKDLVRDMVSRLQRDIMVARNRLDAIRPPG